MSQRPEMPVALITGAADPDGIGATCARALAAARCRLALLDRHSCEDVAQEVSRAGHPALTLQADLSVELELDAAADQLESELGSPAILINNAADLTNGRLAEVDGPTLAHVLAVNVVAPWLLCRRFVPAMVAVGWGRVINIASDTFDRPPGPGFAPYVSSKGAVIGMTRALARELGGDGVTVNAIAPGLTRTGHAGADQPTALFDAVREAQALDRTLVPEDYAGLVTYLASDGSAIITGQTIRANGGLAFA